jgi:protease IV
MLESLQGQVWQAIGESRNIDPGALDALADRAPLLRDEAVASGLVDRIGFRDEAHARIAELVGVEDVSPESSSSETSRRGSA